MAEPTLAAAYNDLTGDVGFFLGFGRGANNGDTAWTTQQQTAIDRCVKGGLRKFYHCGYDWSFLKPVVVLALAAKTVLLPLPEDFGGFEGMLDIALPAGQTWWRVELVGVGEVLRRTAEMPTTTGRPWICCLEAIKGTTGTAGTRSQLRFFPIADQAYQFRCRYYINPNYLDASAFPYAYGGAQHAETILEAALSVAELILDDSTGIHAAEFDKLLMQSQDIDRRNKPQNLGYNGDKSDLKDRWGRTRFMSNPVTYNGQPYS